jgi:hypothetical protein
MKYHPKSQVPAYEKQGNKSNSLEIKIRDHRIKSVATK